MTTMKSKDEPSNHVHVWFSLSYANYLVLPRLAMQEMPEAWQKQMVGLLEQINERFPTPTNYTVRRVGKGKFAKDLWSDYRHGDAKKLVEEERNQPASEEG